MNCAESNAKVLLVERDRDVFVDPIAHIANHEFLESNRFEFDLVLDVFARALERKLLRSSVIEQIGEHELNLKHHLSLIEVLDIISMESGVRQSRPI